MSALFYFLLDSNFFRYNCVGGCPLYRIIIIINNTINIMRYHPGLWKFDGIVRRGRTDKFIQTADRSQSSLFYNSSQRNVLRGWTFISVSSWPHLTSVTVTVSIKCLSIHSHLIGRRIKWKAFSGRLLCWVLIEGETDQVDMVFLNSQKWVGLLVEPGNGRAVTSTIVLELSGQFTPFDYLYWDWLVQGVLF